MRGSPRMVTDVQWSVVGHVCRTVSGMNSIAVQVRSRLAELRLSGCKMNSLLFSSAHQMSCMAATRVALAGHEQLRWRCRLRSCVGLRANAAMEQSSRSCRRLAGCWSATVCKKAALVGAGRLLHQVAVHHHQDLRNRAVEGRRFVPFVGAEGDGELPQPLALRLLLLFVAAAGLVGLRWRRAAIRTALRPASAAGRSG